MVINTAQRLGAPGFVSKMIELTKISADKVHKLFRVLIKLELFTLYPPYYRDVDEIYDAWRFAERNSPHIIKRSNEDEE